MQLAYRSVGSGVPLIILHGLFGQSDNWNSLAKQFSNNNFEVFTVDQRNHGLSPHSNEWNYEVMADDLYEFINSHKLHKPIILGHSMGGKTTLFFELKYKGIAAKLVIADIAAKEYPPHHKSVLDALNAVNFSETKTRKEAEEVLSKHITDFGTKQFLLKNIYWKDTDNNLMDWRFNLKTINQKYSNICVNVPAFTSNTPALIVKGEKSDYINNSDIEDFKTRFFDIKFSTIANAGHWVHAEKPQEFYNEVLSFIVA